MRRNVLRLYDDKKQDFMIQRAYRWLERNAPTELKERFPQKWRIWLGYQIKVVRDGGVRNVKGLVRPLSLPPGETEKSLKAYLDRYWVQEDGRHDERKYYMIEAFNRFLYTLELVPDRPGRLLELGASPYFISLLLQKFRPYEIDYVNYFGDAYPDQAVQTLVDETGHEMPIPFANVNVEVDPLPYPSEQYDAVLLCEVLEHFTDDPQRVLTEIKRVLKPDGTLILSTPNVVRLENVARSLAGINFYDPYSGYGAHGRHNREYTVQELRDLLAHVGFTVDEIFTSDVYNNRANQFMAVGRYKSLLAERDHLGQYIFVKARKTHEGNALKPAWLYRNYPAAELTTV